MTLLIVKNSTLHGPGVLEQTVKECEVAYEIKNSSDDLPNISEYSGLVVLHGNRSANDPALEYQIDKVREHVSCGKPYLGIGLGMHLLVKALGGTVKRMDEPEVGWSDPRDGYRLYRNVGFYDGAGRDRIFSGANHPVRPFQFHNEEVERLPDTLRLMGWGNRSYVQVVGLGAVGNIKAYGMQGMFTTTSAMARALANEYPHLAPRFADDIERMEKSHEAMGRLIFGNWLKTGGYL